MMSENFETRVGLYVDGYGDDFIVSMGYLDGQRLPEISGARFRELFDTVRGMSYPDVYKLAADGAKFDGTTREDLGITTEESFQIFLFATLLNALDDNNRGGRSAREVLWFFDIRTDDDIHQLRALEENCQFGIFDFV